MLWIQFEKTPYNLSLKNFHAKFRSMQFTHDFKVLIQSKLNIPWAFFRQSFESCPEAFRPLRNTNNLEAARFDSPSPEYPAVYNGDEGQGELNRRLIVPMQS